MTDLTKILVQEEEELAEACKNHPDMLASIHNNAGENFFKLQFLFLKKVKFWNILKIPKHLNTKASKFK